MTGAGAPARPPRIVVAGAAGCVGTALLPGLAERGDVVALTRIARASGHGPVRWRRCDLLSARETEVALEGADYAFFLLHDLPPPGDLAPAAARDFDLLRADNFARAASRAGVRQIVHLGGLFPDRASLPPHLEARRELERVLGARGVPLTSVRAGLLVGEGAASFGVVLRLLRRLPVLPCPRWTLRRVQPIALQDAAALLLRVLGDEKAYGASFEIGGPEAMTYREMLRRGAAALGIRRWFLPLPVRSPRLSARFVSLVTGAPRAHLPSLVEALSDSLVPRERRLQQEAGAEGLWFEEAVRRAAAGAAAAPVPVAGERRGLQRGLRHLVQRGLRRLLRRDRRRAGEPAQTCAVERLPLPPGGDAASVAREFLAWLPRRGWPFLAVVPGESGASALRLRPFGPVLLVLRILPERSDGDRVLLRIEGGALVSAEGERKGRLEFRALPGGSAILAALHDYVPRLPGWLYHASQARLHRVTMRRFARHLSRGRGLQAAPSSRLPKPEGA